MHRNIVPSVLKMAIPVPVPVVLTAILLILFSADPVQGETKTSKVNKQYTKKDQFRIITPSAPKTFQIYHSFTYDEVTREYTYTTWSYNPYDQSYDVHDTHDTRAAAVSAKPSGGKITVSSSVVGKKTGLKGTEVVSSCSIQKASISPEKIAEYAKQQLEDSKNEMEESEVQDIVDEDHAAESEEACDPEPVEEDHDSSAEQAEEEAEEEEKSFFARAFGDPVQLSSGSLLLAEEDVRIPLPGDAPDFRLSRTYRSADLHCGPQGRHWFGSLESRLIRCNSLPFWTSGDVCRQEIERLRQVLLDLDTAAENEKTRLELLLPDLLESAEQLETAALEYLSKSRKANSAGQTGYSKLSRRCSARATLLRERISLIQERIELLYGTLLPAERQRIDLQISSLKEMSAASDQYSMRRQLLEKQTRELYSIAGPPVGGSGASEIQSIGKQAGLNTILWISPSGGLRTFHRIEEGDPRESPVSSDGGGRHGGLPKDGIFPASSLSYRCTSLPRHRLVLREDGSMCIRQPGNILSEYDSLGRFRGKYRLLPPGSPLLLYEYRYAPGDGKPGYLPESIMLYGGRQLNLQWINQGARRLLKELHFTFPGMEKKEIIYSYSPDGYLQSVDCHDGRRKEYTWNTRLVSSRLMHPGDSPGGTPDIHKTYSYDNDGRVISVRDSRGFSEEFSYFLRTGSLGNSVARARYSYDPGPGQPGGNSPGAPGFPGDTGDYGEPGTMEYEFDNHGRISLSRTYDSRGTLKEIRRKEYFPDAPGLLHRELITSFHADAADPDISAGSQPNAGLQPTEIHEEVIYEYFTDLHRRGLLKRITRNSDDPRRPPGTFSFQYNDQGYLTQSMDPDGVSVRYSYTSAGLLREILKNDGGRQRYDYDSRGLCTRFSDEEGNSWQYDRDQYGNRSLLTDPLGNSYAFQFDALGRCNAAKGPLGEDLMAPDFYREIVPPPDPHSLVPDDTSAAVADRIRRYTPAGRSSEYLPSLSCPDAPISIIRDTCGRTERIDYPGEADILIRYDRCGRIIQITHRNGGTSRYEYDPCGRIISITGPLGARSEYHRDARGRVIRIIENICTPWPQGLTQKDLNYDHKGLLVEISYPDGSSETFNHDEQGRIVSRRDRWGRMHRITRIEADQGENTPGANPGNTGDNQATEVQEDTSISYESPGTYRREIYDSRLRLKAVLAGPDSRKLQLLTDLLYSPDGMSRASRPGGLNSWRTHADMDTGLRTIRDPDGREQISRFDAAGRVIGLQRGQMRRDYARNADGRIVRDTGGYPSGAAGSPSSGGREIAYQLDYLGRIVREERSRGGISSYTYRGNRLIRSAHSDGRVLNFSWNPAGQLLQAKDAGGGLLTSISYDPAGRITNARARCEYLDFTWDREDRLRETVSQGSGLNHKLEWDSAGMLKSIRLSTGDQSSHPARLPSCEYQYDEADRIIGICLSEADSGGEIQLQFRRDGLGRISSVWKSRRNGNSAPELLQRFSYTRDGCMESDLLYSSKDPQHPSGGHIYSYTPGRKLRFSMNAEGGLESYQYGASGELISALTPPNTLYEPNGRTSRDSGQQELVWAGIPADHQRALSELWDSNDLPRRFSPYQQLEKAKLTPRASGIELDGFDRIVRWELDGNTFQAAYNSFSRLSRLDITGPVCEVRINYEYDALNRLSLKEELSRRSSPDRERRPIEQETLRRTRFTYMGTSSRVLATLHYSSHHTYLQPTGPGTEPRDGENAPMVPEKPEGDGYRSNSPGPASGQTSGSTPGAFPDGPQEISDDTRQLTLRAICMYHWADGSIVALSIARSGRPGVSSTPGREDGMHNPADQRFRSSSPPTEGTNAAATQSLSHYYLPNSQNGSKQAVVDLQNLHASMIHYEVYGKPQYHSSENGETPLTELTRLGICVPGFAGRGYNPSSGLINFGYRFYLPSARRFLTPDPLRSGYNWTAYCDDDPVNFTDSLGLQKQGFVHYDVEGERFSGFTYDDEDDTLDSVVAFDVYTTNNLMDREYPTRDGKIESDPVDTILESGKRGHAYYPQGFPRGAFKVTGVHKSDDPLIGEYFIATDVTVEVETYKYDLELEDYVQRVDESGTTLTETDSGYGFHAGGYSGDNPMENNNPDDTTLGCGRQNTEDNAMLAKLFKEVLDDGGTIEGCAD